MARTKESGEGAGRDDPTGPVTFSSPVVFDNVIGGKSVAPRAGGRRPVNDPTTGNVYAHSAESDADDIDAACAEAAAAFLEWSRTTPAERSAAMLEAAALLEANADELTRIEVADTGKPYAATREDELPPIIDQVRFFAGACRLMSGLATGEYMARTTSGVRREPVGVCGQITPWNYPLMMAVWKWAPAIAAGNTVVLKPSELTPASTVRMAELLADVFPPGVLNVVCGGACHGRSASAPPGGGHGVADGEPEGRPTGGPGGGRTAHPGPSRARRQRTGRGLRRRRCRRPPQKRWPARRFSTPARTARQPAGCWSRLRAMRRWWPPCPPRPPGPGPVTPSTPM